MTAKQKAMLLEFAAGVDVNLTSQIARLAGKREENSTARTILALLRHGMLRLSRGGGLEVSQKGRDWANRIRAKESP